MWGTMRLSLRVQLALSGMLLVVLTVGTISIFMLRQVREVLTEEVKERGVAIGKHLAGTSADYLLARDKLALANFTRGAQENKGVIYAQILDAKGYIRAAAPPSGIEGLYYPPAGLEKLREETVLAQRYYNGRQWVQDVGVTIWIKDQAGRKRVAGYIHVGLDETLVDDAIAGTRNRMLQVTVVVLGLSLVLTLLFAWWLARPVLRLTHAAKSLGAGALDTRVVANGPEEMHRLAERFNAMAAKLESMVRGVVRSLAVALAEHDQVSPGHADRVAKYAARTAKVLGLDKKQIENIRLAAQLIDIGHMGLPANMLHKAGGLSDDEVRRLRTHPQVGARIIEPVPMLNGVVPLMMHHHERWDGRGYPLGLRNEAIPLGARILAVADSFDAMLTERRHRSARNQAESTAEIERCAGTQFDPKVVDAFVKQLTGEI